MKGMTPENIARACQGTYVGPEECKNTEITGVVIDSRKVEPGNLFIPIKGSRVDGHDFIDQVFEAGAALVLSEKDLEDESRPYVKVDSTLKVIRVLAAYYRSVLKIRVVGVTGSVGKTSTKEMIASVLSEKYKVLKTEGNFNNEIGLPLTVFRLTSEHKVAVLEMGISHFGDMDMLAEIARPDICVITNIAECHLENLGDRDGVLRAKTEVFKYMMPGGVAILNGDDDKLATVKDVNGRAPVFFGIDTNRQISADKIDAKGIEGTDCHIKMGKEAIRVHIGIPGRHMVYNAMAASAVGRLLGLSPKEIKKGIEAASTIAGRCNIIHKENMTVIDDCYNANPQSMRAALDLLSMAEGRKIAILGDMFELGPDELELHYNVGKYAVDAGVDYLICVGERSLFMCRGANDAYEFIKKDAPGHTCKIIHTSNLETMPNILSGLIQAGDTVLLKASHAMEFEKILRMI
ncbi:MAG: UDP-N-acetylmuramoyl-tripeptide--D-alanyl-D-alanine ligase [Lachnospiraceae bacterium]|nr:UDP-N-acetylmuramoyl-tripeptide--D-alanyl-D-alanine ligase [Lachnospiraceae bacterium]